MRYPRLVLALALLVVSMAAPAFAETPQIATAPEANAQVTLEDLLAPAPSVEAEAACNTPESLDAAAAFCPYGGPDCVEHDDCDDFCGSPDFGYCAIQGSFPTGCCLCLG